MGSNVGNAKMVTPMSTGQCVGTPDGEARNHNEVVVAVSQGCAGRNMTG